jgi:hypothetical protein
MGNAWLGDAELVGDLSGSQVFVLQQFENFPPCRVVQGLEYDIHEMG